MMNSVRFVTSTLVAVFMLSTAGVASAQSGYGGGGGGSRANVEICQNGKTIMVSSRAVKAFLNKGDTLGACAIAPAPQVLGTSTVQFVNNLSQGMTSNEVKQLQEALRAKGFFTFRTSTGFFGPITLAAVKAFQSSKGIPETGFVGPLTRAALNAS